jgi:hypothetical protein
MRASRFKTAILAVLLLAPGLLRADVDSGPQAGSAVEALKAAAATGDDAGKEVNFTAQRKDKPTIVVFVQGEHWGRPMARFLRAIDDALAKDRTDVHVVAVWLTDEADTAKEYLPRAQQSLKLAHTTFAVSGDGKSGPKGWGINLDAHLTAVVIQEQKVTASLAFQSLNETDAPSVLKKLKPKK